MNYKKLRTPLGYEYLLVSKFGDIYIKDTMEKANTIISQSGYYFIVFNLNGKNKCLSQHRLIALAWIPNPENKPAVNHIDGNKTNNSIDNLEWVTHAENMSHAYRTGLNKGRKGIYKEPIYGHNPKTGDEFILYNTTDTIKRGFSLGGVTECANMRITKHKGYIFRWQSNVSTRRRFISA